MALTKMTENPVGPVLITLVISEEYRGKAGHEFLNLVTYMPHLDMERLESSEGDSLSYILIFEPRDFINS